MIAWFMYYNEKARKAFTIDGELLENSLYQDVQRNKIISLEISIHKASQLI